MLSKIGLHTKPQKLKFSKNEKQIGNTYRQQAEPHGFSQADGAVIVIRLHWNLTSPLHGEPFLRQPETYNQKYFLFTCYEMM